MRKETRINFEINLNNSAKKEKERFYEEEINNMVKSQERVNIDLPLKPKAKRKVINIRV